MRMPRCLSMTACLLALLVSASLSAGVPPLNDPPGSEFRHGKFIWIDLLTADIGAAQKFYGALFGWSFEKIPGGRADYALAWHAGFPVAGLAARQPVPGQVRQARWIAYMSVADVDQAVAGIVAKGGKVLIPARLVEGRGRMAVMADPDGAPFGLVKSSSGDPPDYLAELGEWIWAIYQSADAGSAAAFYQDVGNYEVIADEDRLGNSLSFTLQAEGFARANLVEIPAGRTELRPDWLYFVRVADVAASVAKAIELGGRVIVPPRPDLLDGRMAVITDPAGAPLGLLSWTPDDGEDN